MRVTSPNFEALRHVVLWTYDHLCRAAASNDNFSFRWMLMKVKKIPIALFTVLMSNANGAYTLCRPCEAEHCNTVFHHHEDDTMTPSILDFCFPEQHTLYWRVTRCQA